MFSFGGSRNDDLRCGVVADIDSGSVSVAIVVSKPEDMNPEIVWSHQERLPVARDLSDAKKRLSGAFLNSLLELGTTGLRTLGAKYPGKHPKLLQVSIPAPYAYTITRSANIKEKEPVSVTKNLISELEAKATEDSKKQAGAEILFRGTDLVFLSHMTVALTLNGYKTDWSHRNKAEAEKISLWQLSSVASLGLCKDIEEARDKILPRATIDVDSFASIYFRSMADRLANVNDFCLINVKAEATEISVVRDRIPVSTNFKEIGVHSLCREVVEATGLSSEDALSLLRDNSVDNARGLSAAKKEELGKVIESFDDKLLKLFQSAGDALSVPRLIYLHCDRDQEAFFTAHIKKAAELGNGTKIDVRLFSPQLFDYGEGLDPTLLCSSYVFHKKLYLDEDWQD